MDSRRFFPKRGESLQDLFRRLVDNGGSVRPIRRTGEIRLSHPRVRRTVRVNGRRKDAPRKAVHFVSEVMRKNEQA